MNRERHFWLGQTIVMVVVPVSSRDFCRTPVVAVKNIRLTSRAKEELERSVAEEVETLSIIVSTVHRVGLEHAVLRLDEEALQAFHLALFDANRRARPIEVRFVFSGAEQD